MRRSLAASRSGIRSRPRVDDDLVVVVWETSGDLTATLRNADIPATRVPPGRPIRAGAAAVADLRADPDVLGRLLDSHPRIPVLIVGPDDDFEAMTAALGAGLEYIPAAQIPDRLAHAVARRLARSDPERRSPRIDTTDPPRRPTCLLREP